MANANPANHVVNLEKTLAKSPSEIFRAIAAGRLFQNCSADMESMEIDFRQGGKYRVFFKAYDFSNHGSFLEIVQDRKVVFTWCQDPTAGGEPDTTVTIELEEKKPGSTLFKLVHTGFSDQEGADNHEGGWTSGISDLMSEMNDGKIRFCRAFKGSIDKLFEVCTAKGGVFGDYAGQFVVAEPKKKISFPVDQTRVTLTFDTEDDNGSSLELVHEGLTDNDTLLSYRQRWEGIYNRMLKTVV